MTAIVQPFTGGGKPLRPPLLRPRGRAGGPERRLANALVVVEIAVALVLLGSAAVIIRSFAGLHTADPGFDTEPLLHVRLKLPEARYGDDERIVAGIDELTTRLAALLALVALIASLVPARRAASVDPVVALRFE